MSHPTPNQLRDWCRILRSTDWETLFAAAIDYSTRDVELAVADGYPKSTTGGGRGGSEHTSVEAAVLELEENRRDIFNDSVTNLVGYLHDCLQARNAAVNRRQDLDNMTTLKPKVGRSNAECAEPNCSDPSDNLDGRCFACYQYRLRWAQRHDQSKTQCPIISRETIKARISAREARRVHVTGPLADGNDIAERLNPGHANPAT